MSGTSNPFDDPAFADEYEQWYSGPGRRADALEKDLLHALLGRLPQARAALEVGCGTGHFTRWLAQQGLEAIGLDISERMLIEAQELGGPGYVRGDALALPFSDGAFDLVAFVTTLEFVADPERALAEAVRVARRGLLLGVLNRNSLLALRRRALRKPPWNAARFFSPKELARLVQAASKGRLDALRWRTTLWPLWGVKDLALPWGGFIGMAIELQDS